MIPLETNQQVLNWIGVIPVKGTANMRDKILSILTQFVLIVVPVSAIIGCAVFFMKNISIDMTMALFSFLTISGIIAIPYTFIVALVLRHKIIDLFTKLSDFYKTCMYLFGHFFF